MTHVQIYTDGACQPNPGKGGWAALLVTQTRGGDVRKLISGSHPHSTNNRMEMTAVIEGLRELKFPCRVTVYTDSQLVVNCAQKLWSRKQNADLWRAMDRLMAVHQVTFEWVKGHAGHDENEAVNAEAQRMCLQAA